MNYWIVSSKHSRDESTRDWGSKLTADTFLKSGRRKLAVKVKDIFGNDTMTIIEVKV